MNKALVFVATLVAGTAVATAAEPEATSAAKETAARDKQICRTISEVGSRLSRRRICATKAQWDEMALQNRLTTDRIQSFRPTSGN